MEVKSTKHECLNPHSGRSMFIDKEIYDMFSKAITHVLKEEKQLLFSGIVDNLHSYFENRNIKFERSVDWYAISVKNDMEARGLIKTHVEKGKKWNSLSK
jgi:hypothetical protein